MEFWEFLLQKEGDRSWLPLESPNVEILEGRYRVVARSSRPNTSLEIKVTQQDLDEMPPTRRTQKRSGKTNPQGLVVIMPFTRLQPGDWELRCTGDLMDDMLGNGWTQRVQLQVLPIELDSGWQDDDLIEENSNGSEDTAIYLKPPSETDIVSQILDLPEPPIALNPSKILEDSSLAEVLQPVATTEAQPTEAIAPTSLAEISPAEIPPLCLLLPQDTWVIQRNQPLTLTGTIAALEESSDSFPIQLGQLRIRLFDPQNSKMLFDQHYPVQNNQLLPIPFACELSLPADSSTYLVLGELALYGISQPGELPPVLATQSFNVTTELHELLEAIADSFPSPDLALPPQATVPKEAQLAKVDLSFFNIPPVTQTLLKFQSSEQNFLPPQLHPINPSKVKSTKVHRLDLPSFTASDLVNGDRTDTHSEEIPPSQEIIVLDSAVIAEIVANISSPTTAEPAKAETAADLENYAIETVSTEERITPADPIAPEAPTAPVEQAPPERVDELTGDWDEDWEIAADGTLNWRQLQQIKPATPEDRAFRSLNLQDRFLNRLQTLATDPEISHWLREPTPPASAHPIDQEIVVDDDQPSPSRTNPAFSFSEAPEPVPAPQLEVPTGELMAGQPINVIIRLPKSAARIYAKLWVRDRQLRILIESPRWLIDFKPDGFGGLKAQTTVTLPLGCLEVQFEAIAVEMTSQSESQRTIVCRSVISPELTALSLEEFEG